MLMLVSGPVAMKRGVFSKEGAGQATKTYIVLYQASQACCVNGRAANLQINKNDFETRILNYIVEW